MSFLREANAEPIPGYRLIEPLGNGGFGEVWKCEAPGGLYKAIKLVYGNLNSLDVDGARAEQEFKALNRVKEVRHPFVLSMDRIESVGGQLVIVMELADRSMYDAFLECVEAGLVGIPRDSLLRYVRDAAEALDHMNEKHNLQHLDVKPRNLFLVSDRVKVADFGLVKHLERSNPSSIHGGVTPLYAPPETFSGKITGTTDQYSLGIVYMEMLTGQRPFNGKTVRALVQQHQHEEPNLKPLPEAERPIVRRALDKDPAKRFPNCIAFVRALFTCRSPVTDSLLSSAGHGAGSQERLDSFDKGMDEFLLDVSGQNGTRNELRSRVGGTRAKGKQANGQHDYPSPSEQDHHDGATNQDSRLGMTMALPETGALRPTLIIGLGEAGREALRELKTRFVDRFGDMAKAPIFRFLYLDTDAEAIRQSVRGPVEKCLKPSEVQHLPLQPIAQYRKRQLEHLFDWLPREKLYSLPRSLTTQGSRSLGRLALSDNYLRLMTRLKRELQEASNPDTIYQTVSRTGLALRDNVPRVYIIGSALGGSSGCLVDLGYALKRIFEQLHQPEAVRTLFLFTGSPGDPASPEVERANIYATLSELNHFTNPNVRFSAQYGIDGPRLSEEGNPFDSVYLLPFRYRTPECRHTVVSQTATYLCNELTTPLGLRLERCRQSTLQEDSLVFRSMGTFGVWFPRGLLLREAGKLICERMVHLWQEDGPHEVGAEWEAARNRLYSDPDLAPEALKVRLSEETATAMGGQPGELLTGLLAGLEAQINQYVAMDDPENWTRQALHRVQEWLGSGMHASEPLGGPATPGSAQRRSRLNKALEDAADALAEQWVHRFWATVVQIMEVPGRRLAAAEAVLIEMIAFCDEMSATQQSRSDAQALRTDKARRLLENAVTACLTASGAFSWFRGGIKRSLRMFMDNLAAFARQCLTEDLVTAVGSLYGKLRGRLRDRLRDLSLCRQRLLHMQELLRVDDIADLPSLDSADSQMLFMGSPNSIHDSWQGPADVGTVRIVLPDGSTNLEDGAAQVLESLTRDQWTQLDQSLQENVLGLVGGLYQVCTSVGDLKRYLATPMITQSIHYLESQLPKTDVAQVEFSLDVAGEGEVRDRILAYYNQALPLARGAEVLVHAAAEATDGLDDKVIPSAEGDSLPTGEEAARESCFLLSPSSEAGKLYGEQAEQALPHLQVVPAPNQTDMLFCREQNFLSPEELSQLLQGCYKAYKATATIPQHSPHARFDLQDWIPLEP